MKGKISGRPNTVIILFSLACVYQFKGPCGNLSCKGLYDFGKYLVLKAMSTKISLLAV